MPPMLKLRLTTLYIGKSESLCAYLNPSEIFSKTKKKGWKEAYRTIRGGIYAYISFTGYEDTKEPDSKKN